MIKWSLRQRLPIFLQEGVIRAIIEKYKNVGKEANIFSGLFCFLFSEYPYTPQAKVRTSRKTSNENKKAPSYSGKGPFP